MPREIGSEEYKFIHPQGKPDYYDILGISRYSSPEEIKIAYRKKAIDTHPDKGGDIEEFQKITEAYNVLGNPRSRLDYDGYKPDEVSDPVLYGNMSKGKETLEEMRQRSKNERESKL